MRVMTLPPGPTRRIPGGVFFSFQRDRIGLLTRMAREYGDIVHFQMGPQHFYLLNHPDYIRDVLVTHDRIFSKGRALERAKRLLGEGLLTSEGDFHLRQRRMIQPVFHRNRIATYARAMTRQADQIGWPHDSVLDIHKEMMQLTLNIVAETLFGKDIAAQAGEIGEALTILVEAFNVLMLPFSELLEKLPLPRMRRLQRAIDQLDAVIYGMLSERRKSGEFKDDLLSMLLTAVDTEDAGKRMTDRQVRDEAMTLFLAGHETTANALTWTWYLLSQNPEAETRLHQEVDTVLRGRLPDPEDLSRLSYTEQVVAESMRLYPPAWIIGRRPIQDYEVGGYTIPAGSIVLLSQYLLHRDSRFFPQPERFDPERWTADRKATRPRYSYFPFGAGSRVCIGEHFAWMEAILLIATIAQKWQLSLYPGQTVEMLPTITLRPKHGMRMTVLARSQSR